MISILFITLALLLLCAFYSLFLTSQFSIDSSFNKSKEFQGSLLFFALFNFQDAVLFACLSRGQLIYYITFFSICQVLFSSFFKSFWMFVTGFFVGNFYIISHLFRFVNPFFEVFSKLFSEMKYPLFFYYLLPSPTNAIPIGLLFQCSPSTALLLYHSFSPLSSRRLSRVFNRVLCEFTKWRLFQQKAGHSPCS